MTRFLTIWIGAALAALSAAAAPEYWPIDLGTLGGTQSAALGLNDAGQVVGWSLTAGGRTQAFVWAGGTLSGLTNLPGGSNGIATAINRHGDITGYSDVSATNHHAFLYASNHLTDLGTFGGPLSAGYAINDNREITGWAYLPPDTNIWLQAFWWRTNQLVAIPPFRGFVHSCEGYGINDSSFICGTTFLYSPHGHNWAYVWYDQNTNAIADEGEMTPLGSLGVYASYGDYSEAKAINNLGQIVGWTGVSNNWSPKHAFLITPSNGTWKLPNDSWENGYLDPTNLLMRDLGTLDRPTDNSFANAINDRSWIVGTSTTGSGTNQAFLWRDGVMTNLNDLIDAGSGWVLTNAAAINEYNEIAGSGLYYGQPRAFLLRSSSGLSVLGTNGAPVVDSEPPSLAKGTDFGEVLIGQARTNTFILRNLGSSNLHVHGWTTNGAGAARFEFAGIPSTVEIGGASNFTAVFWPATAGVFQAALSLDTDSPSPLTNLLFAGTGARHPQIIDFPPMDDPWATNELTLSAAASSGLAVAFNVAYGSAQITNNTDLTFTGAGEVGIAATQPGDDFYAPAPPVTNVFNVSKVPADVTLHDLAQTYDGTGRAASATTDPAGLVVEFTYDGLPDAPTNAGTYAVTGTVNEALWEGSATGLLTVAMADQSIDFPPIPDQWTTNSVGLAAAADSGFPVEFAVASGPAEIADLTNLTFTGTGQVAIAASQPGDANWNAAPPVTNVFTVSKRPAGVTLLDLAQTYDGTPRIVTAATEPSGLTVNLTYDGLPDAPTNAGTYAVTGTVVEAHWEGVATGLLAVAKADQTIDFPPIADPFLTNRVALSASAGSGLTVTFEVLLGPAQLTNENQLAFSSTGRVAVAASQPGDANWNPAASVTNEFEVWGLYELVIASAHGEASPPAGIHTYLLDTVLTNSIAVPAPAGGTQLVCTGWTLATHDPASGNATNFTLTVTNHAELTWLWTTNFWLETEAAPHGSVQPDSSWQPAREPAVLSALPDPYYHFLHWTNSASGTNNPFALIMDRPKSARAVFAENLAIHDTPEWWLAEYGWTNDFDAAALADDEPDGFPTWQEYVADTNPTNALSYPRIDWIEAEGTNPPRILWPASSNRVYQVHWADGDPTAPWSTQQLFLGAAEWTDTNAPHPIRLYRIAPLRP